MRQNTVNFRCSISELEMMVVVVQASRVRNFPWKHRYPLQPSTSATPIVCANYVKVQNKVFARHSHRGNHIAHAEHGSGRDMQWPRAPFVMATTMKAYEGRQRLIGVV